MNYHEINTDQSSWAGLLTGDKDALYQLYTNYYHTLLFIGLKHTPDAGLVKDVIQQQFLYFWEMRSSHACRQECTELYHHFFPEKANQ